MFSIKRSKEKSQSTFFLSLFLDICLTIWYNMIVLVVQFRCLDLEVRYWYSIKKNCFQRYERAIRTKEHNEKKYYLLKLNIIFIWKKKEKIDRYLSSFYLSSTDNWILSWAATTARASAKKVTNEWQERADQQTKHQYGYHK